MARRRRLSSRKSKRLFISKTVPHPRNYLYAIPMRGGFRL